MERRKSTLMVVAALVAIVITVALLRTTTMNVQASRLTPAMLVPGGPVKSDTLFLPLVAKEKNDSAGAEMLRSPHTDHNSLFLPSTVLGSSEPRAPTGSEVRRIATPAPDAWMPISGVPCNEKGLVTARDGKFWLNGKEFRFTGVNANFLMGMPDAEVYKALRAVAESCGTSVIRVFVTDWGPSAEVRGVDDEAKNDARQLERITSILRIGRRFNLKFIIVLDNTVGHLRGNQFVGSKSTGWYDGEYKGDFPQGSYRRHVERVIRALRTEFRDEIFAWELLNEPNCEYPINKLGGQPDGDYDEKCPRALLNFVRDMSAYIKQLDPVHMVTTGSIGYDQYGSSPIRRNRYFTDRGEEYWDFGYKVIHDIPTIDAVVAHHYGEYHPGGANDAMAAALSIANALNKPFFIEESGAIVPGCPPYTCPWGCEGDYKKQARIIEDFMKEMFAAGAKGFLLWEYSAYPSCSEFSFFDGGFVCNLLERYGEKLCRDK